MITVELVEKAECMLDLNNLERELEQVIHALSEDDQHNVRFALFKAGNRISQTIWH